MIHIINNILKKIGLFNSIKIYKDKYFENPINLGYRKKLVEFYSMLIKTGDLCFDIGASYGNRTEAFLALGANVITVEPQKNEFNFLKRKFADRIVLLSNALGSQNEVKKMFISNRGATSSLSKDWIDGVTKTKRFKNTNWNITTDVEVVTLDHLISKYGKPDFCKVDVEGYELEVLKGLSQPIKYLSFEFTVPEFMESAVECLNQLDTLGKFVCNYSPAESLKFGSSEWLEKEKFIELLKTFPLKNIIDGDVYIHYTNFDK